MKNAKNIVEFPVWVRETLAGLPALVPEGDVAKLLTVDVRTIRRWRASGRMMSVRTTDSGSGRVLVPRAEVGRLLSSLAAGAAYGRGPGAHSPSGAPGLPASEPRSLAEDLAHRLGRAETLIGYLVDRSEDLVDEVSKARRDEEWLARKALSLWSEINAARVFLAEVGK